MLTNMLERTVVAQRIVYNALQRYGGPTSVPISRQLLNQARSNHSAYKLYLEEKKKEEVLEKVAEENVKKLLKEKEHRKSHLMEELEKETREIVQLKKQTHY